VCGIVGFIGTEPGESSDSIRDTVSRMTNALRHRGPDDSGVWFDATVPVALGHRRLSIIDLSDQGHQPMVSASGRYVLVFNGEIYNYRELRTEFPNYSFRGASDSEVMLAAFQNYGISLAVKRFRGMFAFALWDRAERTLHLARDRFGEKPLYYAMAGRTLLFGSELKAVTAHPAFSPAIDRSVMPLFLRYGYVPQPYAIYHGTHKLEPGTCLSITWNRLPDLPTPVAFWSARDAAARAMHQPFRGTPEEAEDYLEKLLGDAVQAQMVADVPLGAFLSGGIDSTMIVALMQKYGTRKARTFTLGFSEKWYDEAVHARAVARRLGTDHTEMYVTPAEAMAVIPSLSSIYDEPFADSSQVPTCLVSQLARQHVTVALTGDGGDEIFGGYNRYVWSGKIWDWIGHYPQFMRSAAAILVTAISPVGWDRLSLLLPKRLAVRAPGDKMHKLAGILDAASRQDLYQRLVSQWPDPGKVAPATVDLPVEIDDPLNWKAGNSFLRQMMLLDSIGYLPGDILVKVDRAAMAVGLETRAPYLDHRLFEFAWSLPDEWKVRNGESKWLLRQVLHRHVPKEMMERPKAGFGIPMHVWMRGPLRDWAENLLDERRLRQEGFFDPTPIRRKWAQHLAGSHNWYPQLWAILMFESWLETRRDAAESTAAPRIAASTHS